MRIAVSFLCLVPLLPAQTAEDVFSAIRRGDQKALRSLPADVKDRLDNTPLHYAALYGNADSIRILLDRGADVKARNKSEATPLIYAAVNLEKTRMLIDKGSDVNAKSSQGITPLFVATSEFGNTAAVRLLIEKGADIKAMDATGRTILENAAEKGDAEMVRLLLAKGADPRHVSKAGFTALLDAFEANDPERVLLLIRSGADVNAANTFAGAVKNGPIDLVHMTPVCTAAPDAPTHIVKALLTAGAHPDEPDHRKFTPLMAAIATDEPKLDTIRLLIASHADVNAKDRYGDSVLDWALKYRNPEVLAILKEAGATSARPFTAPRRPADFDAGKPSDAIARSVALLAKSQQTFFREGGGCVGCHHQPLGARAYAALRTTNVHADERLRQSFLDGMVARRPGLVSNLPLQLGGGGDFDELLAMTQALADLGEPSTASTDVIVHYLAARQSVSGAWVNAGPRPPLQSSNISRTAMAIRALKTYGWPGRRDEFDERISRARAWLLSAKPVTRFEAADRIMGLKAAGVPDTELAESVRSLLSQQRRDGGWSQTTYLDSDAYATGTVLSTLYQAGFLKASDPAYRQGVAYLLKTQFPDGSWYVHARGPKLQPYFQSDFPFDHDQWISASATALAVMALAPAAN
jgi:ankyrin repeat protein